MAEIRLRRKYLSRKPTQAGYSRPASSGNSGAGRVKRVKASHNTCLARQSAMPGASLADVACPHDYRPEEHAIRYDALRGRRAGGDR